jgi:hypothetical protein
MQKNGAAKLTQIAPGPETQKNNRAEIKKLDPLRQKMFQTKLTENQLRQLS